MPKDFEPNIKCPTNYECTIMEQCAAAATLSHLIQGILKNSPLNPNAPGTLPHDASVLEPQMNNQCLHPDYLRAQGQANRIIQGPPKP